MWRKKLGMLCLAAALMMSGCAQTAPVDGTADSTKEATAETSKNERAESKREAENARDEKKDWTVLLYLCGTDLESGSGAATYNLENLMEVDASDRVNFVIQTGGSSQWHTEGLETDILQRFTMNGGELAEVERLSLANMGDHNTLGDFLSWGVKEYPAEKYMVILWDHGGGPLGGAVLDELYDGSIMSVPELAQGLSEAGVEFEVVGFDACLMGNLEVEHVLSPYGKYLVASEEIEPGSGWDYKGFGSYLTENPECGGNELGRAICDSYMASGDEDAMWSNMRTLSVVDMKKVDALSKTLSDVTKELGSCIPNPDAYRNMVLEIDSAEKYYEGSYAIDIGDMLQKMESLNSEAVNNALAALDEAVLYHVGGEARIHSNGLSIMYEQGISSAGCERYLQICPIPEYLAYLGMQLIIHGEHQKNYMKK